jgi:hypothetical protein
MKHERLDARRQPADEGSTRSRREEIPDEPDRVRRRIRDRAERIERHEVAEAIAALEARGGLTDEQRETVRLLGATIARRVTAAPESAVELFGGNEPTTVRAVARLFDVEGEPNPDVYDPKTDE